MIKPRRAAAAASLLLLAVVAAPAAPAAEIAPHRALYSMRLDRARSDSGITNAQGAMEYEWGETCDGWTIQQRYLLKIRYAENPAVNIQSNFVTWESKDGLRYRFNQREIRDGKVKQEIRGEAALDGPGKGGVARFVKPKPQTFKLPAGVLFPSAHTILLIDKAHEGTHFIVRKVFDGASEENAVEVSAVIGKKTPPDPAMAKFGPLVKVPGWPVRLAFFPADPTAEEPDYELGMRLLADGVSQDIVIDYGGYSIRAKLDDIEPLSKPGC